MDGQAVGKLYHIYCLNSQTCNSCTYDHLPYFFAQQVQFVISSITFYHYTCKVMKSKQKRSHETQHTTSTQHTRCSHPACALQLFRSSTSLMMQLFHQMVMLFMKWHIRYFVMLIIGFIRVQSQIYKSIYCTNIST